MVVTGVSTFSGNVSFPGNVSIGGTLTYQDVTNVDSVGLITARKGANSSGPFSWNLGALTTFDPPAGAGSDTATDVAIALGGGHRIVGYFDGYIRSILEWNQSDNIIIGQSSTGLISGIELKPGSSGSVKSYYNNDIKLQTSATGITVTGDVTATSFSRSWILGANGSSDYTFTGPGLTGAENDPTLYLIRGQTYKFVNNMGAHGFRIQSTPNGSTGTQYNDGITNNDVTNGTLTWDVQFDAPDTLYYQCTAHPNMGGIIYIGSESREIPEVSKSTSYTLITSDTGKFVNITSGNITVPSGTFSPGALVTIYNNKSSTMSITASGTTLRKAGTSSTGTCTVAERGTASILCVGSNEFVVAGNIT